MLTTNEFIHYFIHLETTSLLGTLYMTQTLCLFLNLTKKNRTGLFLIFLLKIIGVNTIVHLLLLTVEQPQLIRTFLPIINIVWSIFCIGYAMWKSNLSYMCVQLSIIVSEIMAVAFITFPSQSLNTLLDPTWTVDNTSNFNIINAFVLLVCGLLCFGLNYLFASKLRKFSTIKFSRKYIWYTLIVLYYTAAFSSTLFINTMTARISFLFQFLLVGCGACIIYTISIMMKRREERKLYLEHKYLSIENTLLQEYYKTIELQVAQSNALYEDIQQAKEELLQLSEQLSDKKELQPYLDELEHMIER